MNGLDLKLALLDVADSAADAIDREKAALASKRADTVAELRAIEFSGGRCPVCDGRGVHAPGCGLAARLGRVRNALRA